MVWVIVVAALVVLTLGAWAGTGRLGEMPPVVDDRPKGRIPSGPIDADLLRELRIPTAVTGYSPAQVDLYLDSFAAAGGAFPEGLEAVFDVAAPAADVHAPWREFGLAGLNTETVQGRVEEHVRRALVELGAA